MEIRTVMQCVVEECHGKYLAKGMCSTHYHRMHTRGTLEASLKYHGKTRTPEHIVWCNVKSRCYYPGAVGYKNWGGRGISMCQRWRDSFSDFLEDVKQKPTPNHSLDRVDVNGHYSCGKCEECIANGWTANTKWSTPTEQANNTRANRHLTYDGKTMTCAEWARYLGINLNTLKTRLNMYHWPVERALVVGDQRRNTKAQHTR